MVASGSRAPLGAERLRRSRDFEAVMRHGRRTRTPILHVVAHPNALPYTRVGYAVSRRVGGAVVRNRVKRQLRSLVSERAFNPGFDVVVIPQYPSVFASFQAIRGALADAADRLRLTAAENGHDS